MNVPLPLSTTEPLAGSLKLKVRVSPSISVPLKAIAAVAISSSVVSNVVVVLVVVAMVGIVARKKTSVERNLNRKCATYKPWPRLPRTKRRRTR